MGENRVLLTKIYAANEAVRHRGVRRSEEGTYVAAVGSDDDCIAFFEYVVRDEHVTVVSFGARDIENAKVTEAFEILVSEVRECDKKMSVIIVLEISSIKNPLQMHVMNVLYKQKFVVWFYSSLPKESMMLIMTREPCESDHEE